MMTTLQQIFLKTRPLLKVKIPTSLKKSQALGRGAMLFVREFRKPQNNIWRFMLQAVHFILAWSILYAMRKHRVKTQGTSDEAI